jgi:hypothetical protein
MYFRVICIVLLFLGIHSIVIDIPSSLYLVKPDYNARGFNKTGRYDEIWIPNNVNPGSYYIQEDDVIQRVFPGLESKYTYFVGPATPTTLSLHDNVCIYGYVNAINVLPTSPRLLDSWKNGTFCEDYFCNPQSGIFGMFQNRTLIPSRDKGHLKVHYSLISMCMSCEVTSNQTAFVESVTNGKCVPALPQTYCGDQPDVYLPVYNYISESACYNWKYGRYYGRNDVLTTVLMRIHIFWSGWILLIAFTPLFFLTIIFLLIPAIVMTMHDLDRITVIYPVDQGRFWQQIRRIASLYNFCCATICIAELNILALLIVDMFIVIKFYPYALFLNQIHIITILVNMIVILIHGSDTTRAMQNQFLSKWNM